MEPLKVTFLSVEIKTPPLSHPARVEVGQLIREVQNGVRLSMPQSRPMPSIGPGVHELRVRDGDSSWRVIYRIDAGELLIVDVFAKKSPQTPRHVIARCRTRLRRYDSGEGLP